MASWTRGPVAAVAVLAVLLPGLGRASPPGPSTLWELSARAKLIVLARVVKTYEAAPPLLPPLPGETEEAHLRRKRAAENTLCLTELEVLETWKGSAGGERLTVHPWDGRSCYPPHSFPEGKWAAVFLSQWQGVWEVTGYTYGARPLLEEWVKFIRARVKEAIAIQAKPPVHPRSRLWWNVRAASHHSTRWDGLYPLFDDALVVADSNATRVPPRPHPLTREAQEQIAAGFISGPGSAWELPLVLMALAGLPSAEVDRAASVLLEELLEDKRGQQDAQDAMDLLRVRLGVTGPGTERCKESAGESAKEREQQWQQYRTCVRTRWERIRAPRAEQSR